jgi:acyl carrier protein
MQIQDVFEKLRPKLATILRVDPETIAMGSSLVTDLDAESIDLAETLMVLEEMFNITVTDDSIAAYLMGGLDATEFYDEERNVTPAGREGLAKLIPSVGADVLVDGELNMYNLWKVLTVEFLCTYVVDADSALPSNRPPGSQSPRA